MRWQHTVNLPNSLTVLRVLLVPLFVFVFFHNVGSVSWRWAAFGVFILAMATDKLDGAIARRWNLVTDFGKIADPLADKAQMAAVLISLSIAHELAWWVTVVILAREIGISVWRLWMLSDRVIPASRGGKLKTVTQTLALGLYLLPWTVFPFGDVLHHVAQGIMVVAIILTVWTGLDYLIKASQSSASGVEEGSATADISRKGQYDAGVSDTGSATSTPADQASS